MCFILFFCLILYLNHGAELQIGIPPHWDGYVSVYLATK